MTPCAEAAIRILHLSDSHVRTGKAWDADPVLRDLAGFIGSEVRAQGLAPDLVVLTGDLAFAGKAQEYRLARDRLEGRLWPGLTPPGGERLPHDPLLLVPGNHDADRGRVDMIRERAVDRFVPRARR